MSETPDLDEPVSLYPLDGEDVLAELLSAGDPEDQDDPPEDDDS